MTSFIGYAVRRRFWRRFHPMVFFGWTVLRQRTPAGGAKSALGLGLIATGLLLRKPQRQLLHRQVIEGTGEVRVKIVDASSPSEG